MEEKGIGRPSTYASIISVLTKRHYVEKDGKYMVPTEVAYKITDMLVKYFTDIMDVGFTAKMEDDLDKIEDGGTDWHKIIADFYPSFADKLKFASTDGDEVTDIKCEKCGNPMIRRMGKYGKYLACSNYPECSNIISESEVEISDVRCPTRRKYGGKKRQVWQVFGLSQLPRMFVHSAHRCQSDRGKMSRVRRKYDTQKGQVWRVSGVRQVWRKETPQRECGRREKGRKFRGYLPRVRKAYEKDALQIRQNILWLYGLSPVQIP
jgi:ssDNA-binding Zn-finger/Zn-ribbon topoisomerase 1